MTAEVHPRYPFVGFSACQNARKAAAKAERELDKNAVAVWAFIASEASRGKGAIGIAWDRCISLRQNSDERHRCMHSSPFYGEIRPGELVTRRGVILFSDTAQEVASRFRDEAVKPYLGCPV